VQKYIEKPLLFKGRKFDIRVWALATGRKELFYYKFGYLRTSSFGYSTGAKDNYIHLTNNCLQKWGDNYGLHEDGNTLSFDSFQAYLDREYPELHISLQDHIVPRIKDMIIDSYLSAKKVLHGTKRRNAFELLGYDFLIDEDFRVWLLEVNTNPYLGVPNDYIKGLMPVMLDDMLSIAVDPFYPPTNARKRTTNDFQLLYCEPSSVWCKDGQTFSIRRPFNTPLYPFPTLAQVPMYRQNASSHMSLMPEGEERAPRPVIVKDTYTTLKEILDSQLYFDVSDFSVITSRIISHLQGWELASKEQIASALQALKLLSGSLGNTALIAFGHLSTLLSFVRSANLPVYIQAGVLDALIHGCTDTRLKQELVKGDILHLLIGLVLNPRDEESLRSKHLQFLLALSRHPAKNFYIPGETRENNHIREAFIAQGGLTCLYKLSQEDSDEALRSEIRHHLSSEFNLSDWDTQVTTITKALKPKEPSITPEPNLQSSFDSAIKPLLPSKKSNLQNSSFHAKHKHAKVRFPHQLLDHHFLTRMRSEIQEFCDVRRSTIKQKKEEEAKRREEEFDEKLRTREEEDRAYEDRRQKAEQELIRRFMDRKQKKLEEAKKQIQEREQGERVDEERRQALMDKIRRQEEMRKFEKMKRKQEMEEIKRQEDERQRILEERRHQALSEWLKLKEDQDRERKLKDKQRRDREESKKREELHQRRLELQVKLDERKYRRPPKPRENPGPQSLVVASFIESIDLTRQRSGALEKLELDYQPQRLKLELPRSQPQTRKRRQADQFLFEVYGQVARLGSKKRKAKRTLSKMEVEREGEEEGKEMGRAESASHLPSL
jgi:hypothetical protein